MSRRYGPIFVAAALAIGAGGGAVWWLDAHEQAVFTDDATIEQPLDRAQPRDILWRPPELLAPDVVPSGAVGGAFRADGRFAFAAPGPEGDLDLFEAVQTRDGWESRRLEAASSPDQDTTPTYSPDGRWLYFASDRPGGAGGLDLWRAPATENGWGEAEHLSLGDAGPTRDDELSPAVSPDGMLFAYARRADSDAPADLVLLALRAGAPPVQIEHALNTPEHTERSPAFSPAGDFLYFASDRPGGAGGLDLYRTRLAEGRPTDAAWLGEEVNSPTDETDPALTLAGFRLRFRTIAPEPASVADASGVEGDALHGSAPPAAGATAAYRETTAREVYRATRSRWPSLGVSDELLRLLPWLLLILALALLFAGLRRIAAREVWQRRWRTLGLMSRCVLASMALHALLAFLLSLWRVETTIPGLEQGEPSQVRLVSHAAAASAAAQVTGPTLTERTLPEAHAEPASPVTPSQPREHALAADPTVAPPTAQRFADAAANTPEASPVEPATTPARLEAATLPAASPTRSAEARARDASVSPASAAPSPSPAAVHAATLDAAPSTPSAVSTPAFRDAAASPVEVASDAPLPTPAPEIERPMLPGSERAAASEPESRAERIVAAEGGPPVTPAATGPAANRLTPSETPAAEANPIAAPIADAPGSAPVPSTNLPLAMLAQPRLFPASNLPVATGDARAEKGESPMDVALAATAPSERPEIGRPTPEPVRLTAPESAHPGVVTESPAPTDAPPIAPIPAPAPALSLSPPRAPTPSLPVARIIAGVVLNAQTGEPIQGALVRLDGEGDLIRSALVGADGRFTLAPADLPDFAALTGSAEGFAPTAVNVAEADVGDGLWIELRLDPVSRFEIALDPEPDVHHLGNDEFTGRINSQFQVRSQGTRYRAVFALEADQLAPPIRVAELHLFVRGAQNPNPITVNGRTLRTTVGDSPADGSFGEFVARIPLDLLREGENIIEIQATSRQGTDIDDFEFVNPRLLLKRRGEAAGSNAI